MGATLFLGVGLNTAVFSVANVLLLSPWALPDADELVLVFHRRPNDRPSGISPAEFRWLAERTRECAVRRAVGAQTRNIVALVVRRAGTPALGGLACGLLGSVLLAPLWARYVPGHSALDALTLVVVTIVVLVSGTAATWVPTRRALRVAPAVALKADV